MQFVLIKVMAYCIIHIVLAEMTAPGSFGESQAALINSINCNAANVAGKRVSRNINATFLLLTTLHQNNSAECPQLVASAYFEVYFFILIP